MSKVNVKELVDKLNELNINQTQHGWEENIPKEIWDEYFSGKKYVELARGLEVDKHRWYETTTTVIEFSHEIGEQQQIMGINHVSDLVSDSMDVDYCDEHLTFSVMKAIPKITYVDV